MRYYEYDNNGWLIGWHENAQRPNSTSVGFQPILPRRARWNGSAWVEDISREAEEATNEQAERTRLKAAIDKCKAYDPATATANEVRTTLGAALYLLKQVFQELK